MKIQGNTVLITGGATGIGFALAEAFLKEGNTVIICGRRLEKLLEAQKKHPELHIRACDVACESGRNELLEWAKTNFPDLNVLVNNAGIQRDIDFYRGADDLLSGESEIRVNLEAPVYLTALFVPFLAGKRDASIINVSSGLAFRPTPSMPVYCATKAGLHMFCLSLRPQLQEKGIRVFEVIPPFIGDTELNREGRARRFAGNPTLPGPSSAEYVALVMEGLRNDDYEIRWTSKS